MELRNLRAFKVVSEKLNITKAAELLGYSQPTITYQIKSLEKKIGQNLIYRSGNKLVLTPAGEKLKTHVNKLFEVIENMEKDLKELDNQHQSITIAAPEFYCSYFLTHVISEHFKKHSNTALKIESCKNKEIVEKVLKKEVDIGVVFEFQDKIAGIKNLLLEPEDFLLVTTKEIYLENNKNFSIILEKYPFISYTEDYNFKLKQFQDRCLKSINYSPKFIIELGSEEAIKRAILNQTGVALLTKLLIKPEILSEKLIVIHRFENKISTSLVLLNEKYKQEKIKAFTNKMKEVWKGLFD